MSKEIVQGFVRHLFTTFGGYLSGLGFLSGDDVQAFGGAIAVLVGIAWSVWDKKKQAG